MNPDIAPPPALSIVAARPVDQVKLLDAIAQVESGNNPKAVGKAGERGAWQMTADTWGQTTQGLLRLHIKTYSFRLAHDRNIGRLYARHHLSYLTRTLRAALGREPSAEEIYGCWNLGFAGFKRRNFDLNACPAATQDAARRVANIVNDPHAGL